MADLRKAYLASINEDNPNPAAWGDAEKAAFARLTVPWKKIVDAEITGSAAKAQAAGFSPTALAQGKALEEEEAAVKAAAGKTAALRKAIKDDVLGKRRAESEKLLAALRTLLGKPGKAEPKDLTDADLLTELDELKTRGRHAPRRLRQGALAQPADRPAEPGSTTRRGCWAPAAAPW